MVKSIRLSALFFASLFCVLLTAPSLVRGEVKIGQKMPSVSGRNLVGDTVVLDDYYKKSIVVMALWSIYCKPCVAEISSLIKLQDRYKDKITVVGINTDGELTPARVRTFIERYEEFEKKKVNYPIIFDEHNQITKQLGIGYLPTVLAVDTSGKVLNAFVGFDEKDEGEIFLGIERMLPVSGPTADLGEGTAVFDVESQVPACGFYDETGWRESFYGNKDLDKEIDKVAKVAREQARKQAVKAALEKLGITLCEKNAVADCFRTYGVQLLDDPWKQQDCLTNLINSLNTQRYLDVLETMEKWLGTAYYVRQKISVNLSKLNDELERKNMSTKPMSITFVTINMGKIDRLRFEQSVLAQSKFIGKTDFPAYTIYTSQDVFIAELGKMDFGGSKVFVSDAGNGVIEVELWR